MRHPYIPVIFAVLIVTTRVSCSIFSSRKSVKSPNEDNPYMSLLSKYDNLRGKVQNMTTSPIFEFGNEMQKIVDLVQVYHEEVSV